MPAYIPQVLYGATAPALIPGLSPGDIYYQTDTGLDTGVIKAEWEFTFSANGWVQVPIRARFTSWTNSVW